MSQKTPHFHRRGFLKTTLSASAGVMAPLIIPRSAFGFAITTRTIHFYVSNDFLTDHADQDIRNRLSGYVPSINAVLQENTSLQLSCDANVDITFVTQDSALNDPFEAYSGSDPLPANYKFGCWIPRGTYKGNRASRTAMDVVSVRLKMPNVVADDFDACELILHELAHRMGAASGEYYSVTTLADCTGTSPAASERSWEPGAYWSSRQDVRHDPCAQFSVSSMQEFLSYARYCELTAFIIDGDDPLRDFGAVPDNHPIAIEVLDLAGNPISDATVNQYKLGNRLCSPWPINNPFYSANAPAHGSLNTDLNGQAAFTWPGPGSPHSNSNCALLFEANKTGFDASKSWITVFDVEAGILLPTGGSSGSFHYPGRLTIQLKQTFNPTPTDNPASVLGWTLNSDTDAYGEAYLRAGSGASNPAYFDHPLPDDSQYRKFQVLATWIPDTYSPSSVTYTVRNGSNTLATFYANQQVAPADYQDASGRSWKVLGVINNPPTSNTYTYVTAVSGAQADAMLILEEVE